MLLQQPPNIHSVIPQVKYGQGSVCTDLTPTTQGGREVVSGRTPGRGQVYQSISLVCSKPFDFGQIFSLLPHGTKLHNFGKEISSFSYSCSPTKLKNFHLSAVHFLILSFDCSSSTTLISSDLSRCNGPLIDGHSGSVLSLSTTILSLVPADFQAKHSQT